MNILDPEFRSGCGCFIHEPTRPQGPKLVGGRLGLEVFEDCPAEIDGEANVALHGKPARCGLDGCAAFDNVKNN